MSAFLIIDTRIKNSAAYEGYKKLAKPLAEKYGGIYRARGGQMDIRETDLWTPTRVIVIEFPDVSSAPGPLWIQKNMPRLKPFA